MSSQSGAVKALLSGPVIYTPPQLWHLLARVRSWLNGLVSLPVHKLMPGLLGAERGLGLGRGRDGPVCMVVGIQLVG